MDKIEQKVIRAAKTYYGVKTDKEAREAVVSEWDNIGLRGYAVFSGGISQVADLNDKVEYIARLDDFGVYENDIEAAKQAKKDGIKVIPYAEQPKSGDLKYFRFVDTPMNRKLLGI